MITVDQTVLSISLIFILVSLIISVFIVLINISYKIFRFIGLAQFCFFSMIFIFTVIYLIDINLIVKTPHWELSLIIKMAHICGLLGVTLWFLALELLKSSPKALDNTLSSILSHRGKYIFMGFVFGVNMFSLNYDIINNDVRTYYTISLSYLLTPLVYLLFLYYQYSIFKDRTKELTQRTKSLSIIINIYILSVFFSIILLVFGFVGWVPTSTWIFFASLSQLSISYLLLKIPKILLANEQPNMLLILSEDFKDILYIKKFSNLITYSESLIASYLSGLHGLGSKIVHGGGKISKIMFRENTLLVKPIEGIMLCYFYKGTSYYASTRFINFYNTLLKEKIHRIFLDNSNVSTSKNQFEDLINTFFGKENINGLIKE